VSLIFIGIKALPFVNPPINTAAGPPAGALYKKKRSYSSVYIPGLK